MMNVCYLDIETSYRGEITVVGLYKQGQGTEQLIAPDITGMALLKALDECDVIKTYNGSRFDLPVIKTCLGIDLASLFKHEDLMFLCWRHGLKGGLKAVEKQLGINRQTSDVDGEQAMVLWEKWTENNDRAALEKLLFYNREDAELLERLEQKINGKN